MRLAPPIRSKEVAQQNSYQKYKDILRTDFKQSCGYCDDWDRYCGGARGYQIDHFAPKKKFPHLSTTYANLVYSCPFCNRAKWDKWTGNDHKISHNGYSGFVDPCLPEFSEHLERLSDGAIAGRTLVGKYMVQELKLYLHRHRYLYICRRLDDQRLSLLEVLKKMDDKDPDRKVAMEALVSISVEIEKYNDEIFGARIR